MSPGSNPYSFNSNEDNSVSVSRPPSRLPTEGLVSKGPRDTQVTVNEQEAKIKALEEMVRKQEDQLSQARASTIGRKSELPANRNDVMKDVLQDYEKTIAQLKADNLQYKKYEKRVKDLEKEKTILEDEIKKSQQMKIALENQLERWQGIEGNIPELKAKITNLQTDVSRFQNEVKRLRGENDSLQKKLADAEGKHLQAKKYEQEINNYVLLMRDYEDQINFLKEEKKAAEAGERGRRADLEIEIEKLRDRNTSLTSEINGMYKQVDEAKATMSSNSVMINKVKQLENENTGLKSMLVVNQKIPKNQIFNDDIRPSTGTTMGDASTLPSTQAQLVITRLELIRVHEENFHLKKNYKQAEQDIVLLKQKLYKKSSAKAYTALATKDEAQPRMSARSMAPAPQPMTQSFSKKKEDFPSYSDNEPEDRDSNFSSSKVMKSTNQPGNKQVTFDLPTSEEKSKLSRPLDDQNKMLTHSEMRPTNERKSNLSNKYNRSSINPGYLDDTTGRDTFEIKELEADGSVSPKFGADKDKKRNLAKSHAPDPSDNKSTGGSKSSKKLTYQDFEIMKSKSQEEIEKINASQVKRSNISKPNGNPNRVTASPIQKPTMDTSYPPEMDMSRIQASAINQVPIDPYQESYIQGYGENQYNENQRQPQKSQLQKSNLQKSQIPQAAGTVAIDPVFMSQMMAMLQPQNNGGNNLGRSQTPQNVPIDPMAASQMMAVLSAMQQNQYAKSPMDASAYPQIWNDKSEIAKSNLGRSNMTLHNMALNSGHNGDNNQQWGGGQLEPSQFSVNNMNFNGQGNQYSRPPPEQLVDYDAALTPYESYQQRNRTQAGQPQTEHLDQFRFRPKGDDRSISPNFGEQNQRDMRSMYPPHEPERPNRTSNTNLLSVNPEPERAVRTSFTNMPSPKTEPVDERRMTAQSQGYFSQPNDYPADSLTKTMQPIHIPEKVFKRNVIFTNDGKQVLIPINSGVNTAKQDSGSMAVTMDQMGIKRFNQTQNSNVRRVIDDSAMRSQSPKSSRGFMPVMFQSQAPQNSSGGQPQGWQGDRMAQSSIRR